MTTLTVTPNSLTLEVNTGKTVLEFEVPLTPQVDVFTAQAPSRINDRRILALNAPSDHGVSFGTQNEYSSELQDWLNSFDGTALYFPPGYCFSAGPLTYKPGTYLRGEGMAHVMPQPRPSSENHKMTAGGHMGLWGSGIVFTDAGAWSGENLNRSDQYGTVKPMMRVEKVATAVSDVVLTSHISNISFIQFGEWFDGSQNEQAAADLNLAANYDCGLLTMGSRDVLERVAVIGLFDNGGHIHAAVQGDDYLDPDGARFRRCNIVSGGRILGNDASPDGGATNSVYESCVLFGATYPQRDDSDPDVPAYYIDGATTGRGIRGNGLQNTYLNALANRAIVLGRCDKFFIHHCTGEFSTRPGITGLDEQGQIIGSDLTREVAIKDFAETGTLGMDDFVDTISGPFNLEGVGRWKYNVARGQGGGSLGTNTGKARLQYAEHVNGWVDGLGGVGEQIVTLSGTAGQLGDGRNLVRISNGGAPGTILTLTREDGNEFEVGQEFILTPNTNADVITVQDADGGSFRTDGSVDVVLATSQQFMRITWRGAFFVCDPPVRPST